MAYNRKQNIGPLSLNEKITPKININGRNTRYKNNYDLPFCKTKFEQRSIQYQVTYIWNQINENLKTLKEKEYKRKIKELLIGNNIVIRDIL